MTPPDSLQHNVYCALPGSMRSRSLVSAELTNSAAPGPRTNALPRWLTSNRPTALRVAVCSRPCRRTTPASASRRTRRSSRRVRGDGPRAVRAGHSVSRSRRFHPNASRDWHTWPGGRFLDFDALEAAGIANARERAGLLEYLDGPRFHRRRDGRGRASAAGSSASPVTSCCGRVRPTYTPARPPRMRSVCRSTIVERGWAMLGLTVADPDTLGAQPGRRRRPGDLGGDEDARWATTRAMAFLRVLGATMARLAEAISSMIRDEQPNIWLDAHRRRARHRAGRTASAAEFVPRIGAMIDAVHRHHLISSPDTFIEGVVQRHVGERTVRRRVCGSVRLHRADADAHPDGVVGPCSSSSAPPSATWCTPTAAGW